MSANPDNLSDAWAWGRPWWWRGMMRPCAALSIVLSLAGAARAQGADEPPGARTTWHARPTLDDFRAIAEWDGSPGFVIAMSPKRAAFAATEVTELRNVNATMRVALSAQADELTLLRSQVATLESALVTATEAERAARHDALTWQVRASRPKGRWLAGAIGVSIGVVGGVVAER